ncbi:MAG: hypothetical protein ABR597_14350, partial [Bacteroidales bacterium]
MKKKILSQLMILSFAFAGLFLVGNNVLGNSELEEELESGWVKCRQNDGSGIPFWFRDCGTCNIKFMSYSSSK